MWISTPAIDGLRPSSSCWSHEKVCKRMSLVPHSDLSWWPLESNLPNCQPHTGSQMIEAIFQGLESATSTVVACLGNKGKRVNGLIQQRQHLQGTKSRTPTQTQHPREKRREIASNGQKDKGREKISR